MACLIDIFNWSWFSLEAKNQEYLYLAIVAVSCETLFLDKANKPESIKLYGVNYTNNTDTEMTC